jgi:hypothetical protein
MIVNPPPCKFDPTILPSVQLQEYKRIKESVLEAERVILSTVNFDLQIELPHNTFQLKLNEVSSSEFFLSLVIYWEGLSYLDNKLISLCSEYVPEAKRQHFKNRATVFLKDRYIYHVSFSFQFDQLTLCS